MLISEIRIHFDCVRQSIPALMEKLRELNTSLWLSADQDLVLNSLPVKWQSLTEMVVSTESFWLNFVYPYSMAGPSDCYENAVANASLGRIINDRA